MKTNYRMKATKGTDERTLSFESRTAVLKATDEYLLQGYKVLVLAPRCKHERMNSSAGGWFCPDCDSTWNSKGILTSKGEK